MGALSRIFPTVAPDRKASPYRRASPMLLQAIGRNLWQALESFGQRRAACELEAVAARWQSIDPELARQLRAAACYDTTTRTTR